MSLLLLLLLILAAPQEADPAVLLALLLLLLMSLGLFLLIPVLGLHLLKLKGLEESSSDGKGEVSLGGGVWFDRDLDVLVLV